MTQTIAQSPALSYLLVCDLSQSLERVADSQVDAPLYPLHIWCYYRRRTFIIIIIIFLDLGQAIIICLFAYCKNKNVYVTVSLIIQPLILTITMSIHPF